MPPTASPPTSIAKNVSGERPSAARTNVRPSRFVYGCGNASRRLIQILRLSAYPASASTSDVFHDRTMHVFSVSFTALFPPPRDPPDPPDLLDPPDLPGPPAYSVLSVTMGSTRSARRTDRMAAAPA